MKPMRIRNIRKLVLIRHGQSLRNVFMRDFCFPGNKARESVGNMQDRLCSLTGRGENQARIAGLRLKKLFGVPAGIIHSGFTRAEHTANGILSAYNMQDRERIAFSENNLIRERNSGYLGNMTFEEVREYFPWSHDAWLFSDPFTHIPPGGESIADICEGRVRIFLDRLDGDFSGFTDPTVFVVSHGRTVQSIRYLLEGWNHNRMNYSLKNEIPPNCSATVYEFSGAGRPDLKYANRKFRR
mgnify:FL=1